MFALLRAARKPLRDRLPSQARRRLVLALPAAALVAACQPLPMPGSGGPSINTNRPVPVALLVPKGSPNQGDAVLSASLENSARLAAQELNGVQIDLRVYDTAGDPTTTAKVTEQAIDEGAKIILGPVYAADANAAGTVAAKHGINVLAFSNNSSIAGGNVFILGPTFRNSAERLVNYGVLQGKSRIVVVNSDNAEGKAGKAAINAAASAAGIPVVGSVSYPYSQHGVVNAVPQVVQTAKANDADMIFMTATSAGALPILSQLMSEQGLPTDQYQYVGLSRWDIPSQTLDLPSLQSGWFAMPDPNLTQQFDDRYKAAYGKEPHPIGSLAFDGIAAVGALVSSGHSNALTAQALTQPSGFQGVGGIFRLLSDGTNERGLAVATIEDHQVKVLDPAPTSFSGTSFAGY